VVAHLIQFSTMTQKLDLTLNSWGGLEGIVHIVRTLQVGTAPLQSVLLPTLDMSDTAHSGIIAQLTAALQRNREHAARHSPSPPYEPSSAARTPLGLEPHSDAEDGGRNMRCAPSEHCCVCASTHHNLLTPCAGSCGQLVCSPGPPCPAPCPG
jgi:hypothetical protein